MSSKNNSRCNSATISRESTPLPNKRIKKDFGLSTYVFPVIFFILSLISFIIALFSSVQLPYCYNNSLIFCKRCPSNTIKCEKNTFKCKENHIHNKHQCLETNLTEAELIALHNSIQIDIKNKVINTKYKLFTSNYSFIHKRKDLESAVLYDENYKFGNDFNETILRIPDQMNLNFIWSIFILFFISFLASLESYFFKKLSLSQNK